MPGPPRTHRHDLDARPPGTVLVRRLLPVTFAVPLLLALLHEAGHRGLIPTPTSGLAVLAAGTVLGALLVLGLGRRLDREHAARLQAQERLRLRAEQHRLLTRSFPDGAIVLFDRELRHLIADGDGLAAVGLTPERMEGRTIWEVYDPDVCRAIEPAFRAALVGEETTIEYQYRGLDYVVHVVPVPEDDGTIPRGAAIVTDVTAQRRQEAERDRLRDALVQAQKLESVGRLAAGVAHELNNALMAVSGHAALLEEQLMRADPVRHDVRQILASADRAAEVTRQLLAFGRRQVLHPRTLDVADAVRSCRRLLGPLLPERITLETVLPERSAYTFADPGQLEQVLVNLVLNSRDAIDDRGTITIGVATLVVGAAEGERHGVAAGEYVGITVADTGSGMDAAVLERIFEPFFTTKEVGAGTGLGLATVDGIVRQEGGFVTAASEPGAGTVVTVALPRRDAGDEPGERTTGASAGTTGRAVVADDEEVVREICAELLVSMGYAVATAADGQEALRLVEDGAGATDLLVTDVLMPKLDGAELARRVAERSPGTAIVLMSGHPGDRLPELDGEVFLQKPFGGAELAAAVEAARRKTAAAVTGTAG